MRQTIPELEQIKEQFRQITNSWETSIVVPLTQNIGGGLAATIILAVLTYAWNRANGLPFDVNETLIWAGIAGTIIACLATLVRFFSDEIGLLHGAYKAGQASRDDEIQRLNRQISILEQRSGQPTPADATELNKRLGKMKGDLYNATTLLKILLDGGNISRGSGEHDLTQRPWERAVNLLEKAKVYSHQDRQLLIDSRNEAHKMLTDFYQEQYAMASANLSFQPAWW